MFGEDQARYLCVTESPDALLTAAAKANVSAVVLGATGGDTLNLPDGITISLPNLRTSHEGWFPNYMAGRNVWNFEGTLDMPMSAGEIEQMIKDAMPDAEVRIDDLRGDGDHYAAYIVQASLKERHGCNSIKWCMLHYKDVWAMNCTHWHCRLPRRKTASFICAILDKRNLI